MVLPQRALVRPRIVCPETGETVVLREWADEWFAGRATGTLEIVGDAGAGKTTALADLAEHLPDAGAFTFLDEPLAEAVRRAKEADPTIYTTRLPIPKLPDVSVRLVAWSDDELIEFLLAASPSQCASVMARVHASGDRGLLRGNAQLWAIVLSGMAADENARDVRAILRANINVWLDQKARHRAQLMAHALLLHAKTPQFASLHASYLSKPVLHRLRNRTIQLLLATELLHEALRQGNADPLGPHSLPRDLVDETAASIRNDAVAIQALERILHRKQSAPHAMAASILHATGTAWSPRGPNFPWLGGAYLGGARWPGIGLSCAVISNADLAKADLSGAVLLDASAKGCSFREANLRRANLSRIDAQSANFAGADLENATARDALFRSAAFARANLRGADFAEAILRKADFSGACLREASLAHADLRGATLDGADFSDADLSFARLSRLTLNVADFTGASFAGARLTHANLEGMCLPRADFRGADLRRAWLTGTIMHRADLRRAPLAGAALADIDWENADLRRANFSECTFHLGSTRSGLVGSPLACEGSRTGFYTDEYDEQPFKSPEEIRKANLRGADLRGAIIDGVDFYLVDLRDAVYSREQAEHFRRCGAILVDRTLH